MKFVAGLLNGVLLDNLMVTSMTACSHVRASIAYADGKNLRLLDACKNQSKPLEFYGRYDHSVAISPTVLKWFLDQASPNYQCKLIPDIFHSKVIWWVEAGAYFGSANLSDRAWLTNIEAGTYLSHEELVHNGLDHQLEQYFDQIDSRAILLNREIYLEQLTLSKRRGAIDLEDEKLRREFENKRLIQPGANLAAFDQRQAFVRRLNAFTDEWNSTLQIMRDIGVRVSKDGVRPSWVNADVPSSVQADQFLHAYYYLQVRDGNRHPYEEFHKKNSVNPEIALKEVINWWTLSDFDHEAERRHLHEWAPRVRELCARDRLPTLDLAGFTELLSLIHAVRDHASKLDATTIGLGGGKANIDERIAGFAQWIWNQRSKNGNTALQTFFYVVWGKDGFEGEKITQRLWNGHTGDEWAFPHIGLSTLGELVGWARPDNFPPRNGRTSKALKALGYRVRTAL